MLQVERQRLGRVAVLTLSFCTLQVAISNSKQGGVSRPPPRRCPVCPLLVLLCSIWLRGPACYSPPRARQLASLPDATL